MERSISRQECRDWQRTVVVHGLRTDARLVAYRLPRTVYKSGKTTPACTVLAYGRPGSTTHTRTFQRRLFGQELVARIRNFWDHEVDGPLSETDIAIILMNDDEGGDIS